MIVFFHIMDPLIIIFGPTGVGKSKLGIELSLEFNGEVISMDSMQVYKTLDILTNKGIRIFYSIECRVYKVDFKVAKNIFFHTYSEST